MRSHPPSRCKLIFSFRDNPYFLNSVIIKEYYLDITGKGGSRGDECGCASVWMMHLRCPPQSPCLSAGYRARRSTPVHWFWDFERGALSRRLDTRSLNFLNWLSGHNGPESNRIAEVGLLWACTQLVVDVGVLGCSWEGWEPGQPLADLARVACRSSAKTCGTIP